MSPFACLLAAALTAADPAAPFAIHVVDGETGRGVPLVELKTTSNVVYVTDSSGIVAFDEPGLMNQKVWFTVTSHGYEMPKSGFGFRGQALDVKPGGEATIKIKRINIAQRLYRVTGAGIYHDSVKLGKETPIEQPLLNAKVTGCDSVQTAVYQGKLRWFWGDTVRPAHPLGLFHVPGAVSDLPASGGLAPDKGVNLTYFVGQDGFARATCQMEGAGPTWIDAVTVVPDAGGKEVLLGAYVKIKPPLSIYRRGICRWSDERERFEHVAEMPLDAKVIPFGHTFVHEENGNRYVYFGDPFPVARVPATAEAFVDLSQYEAFAVDESSDAKWAWRKNAAPTDAMAESKLINSGSLKPGQARFRTVDADGKPVLAHRGSVNWNDYRKKWIAIFTQYGGTSMIGEIWYAEADEPAGPWTNAVKIVTHDKYSFYNPLHHSYFDANGGRAIFFEGTYTHTFSGNDYQTPRYDYNQVMYRLELDDSRLKVAQ
ncbi:MAG TPA: hypothetical protein VMP01_03825 [Pirellulaceae bacterium]|nr:hypothetical protein [Pirellulaceae bacterium]